MSSFVWGFEHGSTDRNHHFKNSDQTRTKNCENLELIRTDWSPDLMVRRSLILGMIHIVWIYQNVLTFETRISSQFFLLRPSCKPRSWPMSTPIISILLSRYFRTPDWLIRSAPPPHTSNKQSFYSLDIRNERKSELLQFFLFSHFPFLMTTRRTQQRISHHLAHVIFTHSPHFSFFNFFLQTIEI